MARLFEHAATDQEKALRDPVFASLSDPGAVGRCTKCHSVDTAGVEKAVRWHPFNPAQVTTRFTRFSHDPHISAVGTEGCVTCHALTTGADTYLKSYEQGDPAIHAPNFTPIDKATCATCHTERAAGEECTLCHQYHTGGSACRWSEPRCLRNSSSQGCSAGNRQVAGVSRKRWRICRAPGRRRVRRTSGSLLWPGRVGPVAASGSHGCNRPWQIRRCGRSQS